jgi:site-specific DNA-methyltransferase (adenine-specific)
MLINWDCLEEMDRLIAQDVKVDLIQIDPPYDVSVKNWGWSINTIKKFKNSTIQVANAGLDNGYDFYSFIKKAEKLQDKTNIYIWCNKKQIPMYMDYFVIKRNCLFDILIWNKKNAIPSYNNKYLTDNEYCLYFKKAWAYNKPQNYDDAKTVYLWLINHKDKKLWNHPTIKPLEFIEKTIRNSCPPWGVVFDPFMWSWTTGVACKNLGREFIGIELNETYFNIAKERIC